MTQINTYRVKNSYMYIVVFVNKEIGFHTIGNSTSLSAFGSILKFFWREPVSMSVKVIFLVGGQHDG
jgi:hypothetical protein